MNIDYQLIKEKCPLAYERYEYWIVEESTCLNEYESCYCDLEKFFDENGIRINVFNNHPGEHWIITILVKEIGVISGEIYWSCVFEDTNDNSRPEAKEAAIYKAFEILNNQLKDK